MALTSCLLHPISYILPLTLSLTSCLLYPVSCTVSHILYLTFGLLHLNSIASSPGEKSSLSKIEGVLCFVCHPLL